MRVLSVYRYNLPSAVDKAQEHASGIAEYPRMNAGMKEYGKLACGTPDAYGNVVPLDAPYRASLAIGLGSCLFVARLGDTATARTPLTCDGVPPYRRVRHQSDAA